MIPTKDQAQEYLIDHKLEYVWKELKQQRTSMHWAHSTVAYATVLGLLHRIHTRAKVSAGLIVVYACWYAHALCAAIWETSIVCCAMVDRGTLMSTKKQNGIVSNDCFYEVFSMGMGILLFQTSSNKMCPQACRINLFSFFWRTSCHRHSHLKAQPKWLYYPHAHDVTCYRSPVRYIAHRRNNDPLYDFILKDIQWSLDCG